MSGLEHVVYGYSPRIMLLERSATLLPRLVLCLSLLVATAGLAQDSKVPPPPGTTPTDAPVSPPLMPAGESSEQPALPGEGWSDYEQDDTGDPARFAGRLLLQPPAGLLTGAVGGVVGIIPAYTLSILTCVVLLDGSKATDCAIAGTYAGTALSVSIGTGIGVFAVGRLLGGRGQSGAALGGALLGSALGTAIGLGSGVDIVYVSALLLVGPAVGATLLYAISDGSFPDPTRPVAPPSEEVDEYAWVLPMVSTTRTGGIIGGLIGRF